MGHRSETSPGNLVGCYDPVFRASMLVDAHGVEDADAVIGALAQVSPDARNLAWTLLIGVGAGEPVPERLRTEVEEDGGPLWQCGVLIPRARPSAGATIDPRYYAAFSRVNPVLGTVRPFPDRLGGQDGLRPQPPGADARWDAIVVASALEAEPPRLTKDGVLRKDDERRLLGSLGADAERWHLALRVAQATGLVRAAAGRLYGKPESRARPVTDPRALVDQPEVQSAMSALLRIVGKDWVEMGRLDAVLSLHCPVAIGPRHEGEWSEHEGAWLRAAADVLHRAGLFDGVRDASGVRAVRRAHRRPARPPGFLLTPDRDILIAPGELPPEEYGRLCRVAPYVEGDVVYRHRLTREGVTAELAFGGEDLLDWLGQRSRTGVPRNIKDQVDGWSMSAARFTVLTGVTILERADGSFERVNRAPRGVRTIDYERPPPARFTVDQDEVRVPFGEDALHVRALVERCGTALPLADDAHRWRIGPGPIAAPDRLLDSLRRYHAGPLPGALEASVHAAAGRTHVWTEPALVVHVPHQAAEALQRDPDAGPLLARSVAPGQFVVDQRSLEVLVQRLEALGFALGAEPAIEG